MTFLGVFLRSCVDTNDLYSNHMFRCTFKFKRKCVTQTSFVKGGHYFVCNYYKSWYKLFVHVMLI